MKQIQELYYHIPTDEYLDKKQVKKIYYNVSPPAVWDDAVYELFNISPVYQQDEPETQVNEYAVLSETPVFKNNKHYYEYTVHQYDELQLTTVNDTKWSDIRLERNKLLQETDWTQLPDSPLSEDDKKFYKIYRQELRDVTQQTDPDNIEWPVDPYKDLLVAIF